MIPRALAAIFLGAACAAGEAVVTLSKYSTDDCSGESQDIKFFVSSVEGSPCVNMGSYSVKDQYCDSKGVYRQTMFKDLTCNGARAEQVLTEDCVEGYRLVSCTPVSTRTPSEATATLVKYATSDCSDDDAVDQTFRAATSKGSWCVNKVTYSVKDQYCDGDNTFRQTVFEALDCQGTGKEQVIDKKTCNNGFKLGWCLFMDDTAKDDSEREILA